MHSPHSVNLTESNEFKYCPLEEIFPGGREKVA